VGDIYTLANPPEYLKVYYEYCTKIMLEANLSPGSRKLYLITVEFTDIIPRRDKFVLIQYEHTIVAKNYSPKITEMVSAIRYGEYAGLFQARLLGTQQNYKQAVGIIEYSHSNISHIKNSEFRDLYQGKAVYIAPVFVEFSPTWMFEKGTRGQVTAFGDTKFGRRAKFLAHLRASTINIKNVSGYYDDFYRLFGENSLLVNIHQTEFHSTLEELRVLPALACGLLVISENSPFQDNLIYRDFIEFAKLDELQALLAGFMDSSDRELREKYPREKLLGIYNELIENNQREMIKIRTMISGAKKEI
jgi:hypothetical protein